MANLSKNKKNKKEVQAAPVKRAADPRQLWAMSHAPSLDEDSSKLQLIPAIFFTSIIILIVRMVTYTRPMEQFYWSAGDGNLSDFFSYGKMVALLICAGVTLLILAYRLCTQSLVIKRTTLYIPMAVYCVFVILSYLVSDYKEFALLGYNERFEGTLPLLAYMLMLFFIINIVNGRRSVRWMMYGLVFATVLLSLLGISQALDHDFFQTALGQKFLVPNYELEGGMTAWEAIDEAASRGERMLEFTFQNRQIYQTVYNINYVSFYLTLLVPLFGMLFIGAVNRGRDEAIWKKAGWAVLFGLVIYNLIGSVSSGGFLGIAAMLLLALILLNKRIFQWWKPVIFLLVITMAVGGMTTERWLPELKGAITSVTGYTFAAGEDGRVPGQLVKGHIDYIKTDDEFVDISINGEVFSIVILKEDDAIKSFVLEDADGNKLPMIPTDKQGVYAIDDDRFFDYATVAYTSHEGTLYVIMGTYGHDWYFALTEYGVLYRNGFGNLVQLGEVEAIGFKDNQSFGSGRGFIWSRTIPMMKDTVLLGHGADTYAIHFPHYDYVGKYNSTSYYSNIDIIVDKPHNMYMGAWIGTGGVSVIALAAMYAIYLLQSVKLYGRKSFDDNDPMTYTGAGIALGVFGFLVAGLVNDSSVSVMTMFYGLLGMGTAINMMLIHQENTKTTEAE